jgi:hypothetical protein
MRRPPLIEAGLKTDRQIAELVMGWRWKGNQVMVEHPERDGWTATSYFEFHPSTEIGQAWTVVTKLQRSFAIDLICGRDNGAVEGAIGFDCIVRRYREPPYRCDDTGREVAYAEAPTAQLAICRAALIAVRESAQDTKR